VIQQAYIVGPQDAFVDISSTFDIDEKISKSAELSYG
jgi:hypothetical protein